MPRCAAGVTDGIISCFAATLYSRESEGACVREVERARDWEREREEE